MKVKVLRRFYDRESDLKIREPGEILTVGKERADQLIFLGCVEEFKEVKEPKKAKGGDPDISQ